MTLIDTSALSNWIFIKIGGDTDDYHHQPHFSGHFSWSHIVLKGSSQVASRLPVFSPAHDGARFPAGLKHRRRGGKGRLCRVLGAFAQIRVLIWLSGACRCGGGGDGPATSGSELLRDVVREP